MGMFNTEVKPVNVRGLENLVAQASQSPLTSLSKGMKDLDNILTKRDKEQYTSYAIDKLKNAKSVSDVQGLGLDLGRLSDAGKMQYSNSLDMINRISNEQRALSQEQRAKDTFDMQKTKFGQEQDALLQKQITNEVLANVDSMTPEQIEQAKQYSGLDALTFDKAMQDKEKFELDKLSTMATISKSNREDLPSTIKEMELLGYPLTQEGYREYVNAKDKAGSNTDASITITDSTPKPILDKLIQEGFKIGDKVQKTVYNSYAKKDFNKFSIYTTPTGQQFKMNRSTGDMEIVSNPKVSSKTPTKSMPDGSVAYVDEQGNALIDKSGNIMYKTTSKTSQDLTQAGATKKSLFSQLDLMAEVVKENPSAVGSVGNNFTDFIGNVANDVLKIETLDRKDRERLKQFSGAIAAQLREMSGESGVMTESDFKRYVDMMPSENDTHEAYGRKLKRLKDDLYTKYGNQIKAFYGDKTTKLIGDENQTKSESKPSLSEFGF